MESVKNIVMPPTTQQIEIGNNIRKWRHLRGFKQEILADELNISNVSLSKIETGKADIRLNRLFQIAAILQIPIELIFRDPSSQVQNI